MKKLLVLMLVTFLLLPVSAFAFDLGLNFTAYDGIVGNYGWYANKGEDQETEPGTIANQQWDLEGFFYNGNILNVVGGYDFANGFQGTQAGDIFVDTASVNSGHASGYDYVIDLDFDKRVFGVYSILQNTVLASTSFVATSSPWSYVSGGNLLGMGDIVYMSGLTDAEVGFLGDVSGVGSHNVISLDLSAYTELFDVNGAVFHTTMSCGNDNLMGRYPVPEPVSVLALALGSFGLFLKRKIS